MSIASKHNYTEKELRELDAWIAEHVMEWPVSRNAHGNLVAVDFNGLHLCIEHVYGAVGPMFQPSTDPAAAMQVLEKCINEQRRLNAGDSCFFISKDGAEFWLRTVVNNQHLDGSSQSLPLAIGLFARQLFRK